MPARTAVLCAALAAWVGIEALNSLQRGIGIVGAVTFSVGALFLLRDIAFPSRGFLIRIDEHGIERNGGGWLHGCLPWEHIAQVELAERRGSTLMCVRVTSAVKLTSRENAAASMLNLPSNTLTLWFGGTDVKPEVALQFTSQLQPLKTALDQPRSAALSE